MTKLPAGRRLIPYLVTKNAPAAIAFYTRVFGATETVRLAEPSGRVGHAELALDGTPLMLADEHPELGILGPQSRGGATSSLSLYVEDVDAVARRALEAGAELERPIQDEFYGDRVAHVRDPFGHRWAIATRLEDISDEEMQRRFAKLVGG
ncbi:VOC family protein [Pyxidicoccus sp. 3LFB2]